MTIGADLHQLTEAQRIAVIAATAESKLVGVLIEKKDPEKIARYIRKVLAQNEKVRHVDTIAGPTALVSLVRFGPKVLS